MKAHRRGTTSFPCGFTRLELAIVVGVVVLLAAAVVPAVVRANFKASRESCVARLKQTGIAARIFETDNGGDYPWAIPTNRGGTLEFTTSGSETFRHFQVLSNELNTPRVILCPEDLRSQALSWAGLSNSNISYFVNLDTTNELPESVLGGDRNISERSSFILEARSQAPPKWVPSVGLHGAQGYLLFGDGSVQGLGPEGLGKAFSQSGVATNRLSIP
jgi:type II secretory pathway pseudopilin PulG